MQPKIFILKLHFFPFKSKQFFFRLLVYIKNYLSGSFSNRIVVPKKIHAQLFVFLKRMFGTCTISDTKVHQIFLTLEWLLILFPYLVYKKLSQNYFNHLLSMNKKFWVEGCQTYLKLSRKKKDLISRKSNLRFVIVIETHTSKPFKYLSKTFIKGLCSWCVTPRWKRLEASSLVAV